MAPMASRSCCGAMGATLTPPDTSASRWLACVQSCTRRWNSARLVRYLHLLHTTISTVLCMHAHTDMHAHAHARVCTRTHTKTHTISLSHVQG
jgi:hypothetical protein